MESNSNIFYRAKDGKTLSLKDLRNYTGRIDYENISGKPIAESARIYHKRGRELGQKGQYNDALMEFDKARKASPGWPPPLYDIAYIYLLAQEWEQALKYYSKTLEASPRGFFTAMTAVHTLTREKEGKYPKGLYAAYLAMEFQPDPDQKIMMVEKFTQEYPDFAPAWKELAGMVPENAERLVAIEKGLQADGDADNMGVLKVNKALTLSQMDKKDEAVQILGELALDPESTFITEHFALIALSQILL